MKRPWVSNAARSGRAPASPNLGQRRAAGGEPLDQPLVDASCPRRRARRDRRRAPARSGRSGRAGAATSAAARPARSGSSASTRSSVWLSGGKRALIASSSACAGAGRARAAAVEIGIEALDHLAVGQVGRTVRRRSSWPLGMKASSAATPTARPTAARKPNMPIGVIRPTTIVSEADQRRSPRRRGVSAAPRSAFSRWRSRRAASRDGAVALVELRA